MIAGFGFTVLCFPCGALLVICAAGLVSPLVCKVARSSTLCAQVAVLACLDYALVCFDVRL